MLTEPRTAPTRAVRRDQGAPRSYAERSGPWCLRWAQPVVTLLAGCGLFLLGFGGGTWRISVPLGGGDFLPAYVTAMLWSEGSPFGNTSLGFPFGLEQRYYPTADVLQNLAAGVVGWASGNPFLGINTVYAASFPLTALAMLWVFRTAGLRSWWTVLGSLALTFVPYHWFRLEHIYLSTMYSAVLGVGLAVLIGNGTVERRLRQSAGRGRFVVVGLLLAFAIGASGIYYACFALLLCAAACVYRFAQGARWRDLLLAGVPAVSVAVVLGLCLAPSVLYVRANPPLDAVADRLPMESVLYAGALALALIPAPISRLPLVNRLGDGAVGETAGYPLSEAQGVGNYGSVASVLAVAVLLVGGLLLARRGARARAAGASGARVGDEEPNVGLGNVGLGFVVLLLGVSLLFFVPWGLNYLLALFLSADIRAWNRLLPVVFTLVFLGAGIVLHRWSPRLRPLAAAAVAVLAMGVLIADSVLPYRAFFAEASDRGAGFSGAGYEYAADLNAAVPGDCGVVELPYIPYPEVPPKVDMGNYEPLWPAVTNPMKSWSGAAMKGTLAAAWQAAMGDDIDAGDVPNLVAGGFCAVHVDRRGYTDEDASVLIGQLTRLLGAPVATGLDGEWTAFALPDPLADAPSAEELLTAPDGVGTFYAPPAITPGPGAPPAPNWTPFDTSWWLPEGEAELDVTSLDDGPAFDSITGQLRGGSCAEVDVLVSVLADGQQVGEPVSARLAAGQESSFALELTEPVRDAQLRVQTSDGGACAVPANESDGGAIALVDVQALN